MPQKGQTAKHEWEGFPPQQTCKHCKALKYQYHGIGGWKKVYIPYMKTIADGTTRQPPCITRKIQADGEDSKNT